MRLILDADAIIKLNRAGILADVVQAYECLITQSIYEEVVLVGRAKGYVDAEPIDGILIHARHIDVEGNIERTGLGRGERSILVALRAWPESAVVTDDHRFMSALSRLAVLTLPSIAVVVLLVREGLMAIADGLRIVDAMEPYVSDAAHEQARSELLGLQGDRT